MRFLLKVPPLIASMAVFTLGAAHAAPTEISDVSLASICEDGRGSGIQDQAIDAGAGLVVDLTLFDRSGRVIDAAPLVMRNSAVAVWSTISQAGSGCAGRVVATRVRTTATDAAIDIVIEASPAAKGGRKPNVQRIEETVALRDGEHKDLLVNGVGPIGRVGIGFGHLAAKR